MMKLLLAVLALEVIWVGITIYLARRHKAEDDEEPWGK